MRHFTLASLAATALTLGLLTATPSMAQTPAPATGGKMAPAPKAAPADNMAPAATPEFADRPLTPTLSPRRAGRGRSSPLPHIARFRLALFERGRLQMVALDQRHLRHREQHGQRHHAEHLEVHPEIRALGAPDDFIE